ncbi:hypothetical protein A1O3_08348 [Capronia epimyces CBS 606.96]|uniref:CENP-C homolog n=1 Tax=Capronia epimyces CBS 606.96 TaxID=1182542 RepID=W9XHR1_9EURO|nr:uncharacterized protein A1O3_08348 [Capronia epimyces CBS 606.96]EXJ80062.1 hypothetical protein A1O3_08348 [Capronia epimyces CBS 606.96]
MWIIPRLENWEGGRLAHLKKDGPLTGCRRTGVALDQRPLDANGMEEISGIFSSPRKPSPLKKMTTMENVEERSASPEAAQEYVNNISVATPSQTPASRGPTTRRSTLPPRSTSPKKSGISGVARKSDGVDVFSTRKSVQAQDLEDRENTPTPTATRATSQLKRYSYSPEKTPLRDIATNRAYSGTKPRPTFTDIRQSETEASSPVEDDGPNLHNEATQEVDATVGETHDSVVLLGEDDEYVEDEAHMDVGLDVASGDVDDEEADKTFEPEPSEPPATQNQPNSRKKRKSDVIDDEVRPSPIPTTIRKRGRPPRAENQQSPKASSSNIPSSRAKRQRLLKTNDQNMEMSSRQQQELDAVIEKVKARPDPPRSLYILRRETPMDDAVTHTRSGRVSIKPLAYWRNERCVYGGSPGSGSLDEGARFPLNSIKEIVRVEAVDTSAEKKSNNKKKKSNKKAVVRKGQVEESESSDSDYEMDGGYAEDPHAEPWETGPGTLRGNVSLWDQQEQAPLEEEAEVEIAHAAAAIKTHEVKRSSLDEGPTFRYAKLLSTRFFGTGLVELPPGGMKRPKNSRRMHMSFFVVKGRVSVTVSPIGGEVTGSMTRFSVGKGGFWQVPRGNQYSIQNQLDKTARIFFSQGCEASPYEDES